MSMSMSKSSRKEKLAYLGEVAREITHPGQIYKLVDASLFAWEEDYYDEPMVCPLYDRQLALPAEKSFYAGKGDMLVGVRIRHRILVGDDWDPCDDPDTYGYWQAGNLENRYEDFLVSFPKCPPHP